MMMRMRRMRRDLPLSRLNQLNSSSPRTRISMSGDHTKSELKLSKDKDEDTKLELATLQEMIL